MKKVSFKKFKAERKGYTIIETMVAISLFLVIVMSGMEAFLSANVLNQKSQDLRSIVDNLSFITEEMSRNLRTGYSYHCITNATDLSNTAVVAATASGATCWGIAFESQNGDPTNSTDQWFYYIDNSGRLFKAVGSPYNSANSFVQLTPDQVVLSPTLSGFSVLGAEAPSANNQQPFITIRLIGNITYKNVVTPFALQTSVSQRLIDVGT